MTRLLSFTVVAVTVVLGACRGRAPAAYGEANSVIIAAPDSVWAAVEDTVRTALEPRIFTVRDERAYEVTQIAPTRSEWADLRKFKRVVLIGRPDDPWMADALEGGGPAPSTLPIVLDLAGVWARGQQVHALVLPPQGDWPAAVAAVLPELERRIDEQYRAFVRQRMFASGQNTELQRTLRETAGFSLLLPEVYRQRTADSTYIFYNAYPDPGELMRSVLVTWRPGADARPDRDQVLEWREAVSAAHYTTYDQVTQREQLVGHRLGGEIQGVQLRGVWSTPEGEWPAAGPFITRAVLCPEQERTYLLDAWLYAPGKDKYQYVLQLETILDSFECGGPGGAEGSGAIALSPAHGSSASGTASERPGVVPFHPSPSPSPGPVAAGRRRGGPPA